MRSLSYGGKVADEFFPELLLSLFLWALCSTFRVIFYFYGNTWLLNKPLYAALVINKDEDADE
jgi:hypothetical protein